MLFLDDSKLRRALQNKILAYFESPYYSQQNMKLKK